MRARLFPEAVAPVGRTPSPEENQALAKAMRAFAASGNLQDLDQFLATSSGSPWRVSFLTNLGLLKYDAGFFSEALAHWTEAWALGKNAKGSAQAEAITHRALAEAVKMNCRVGRVADAKALLAELGDRVATGLAASMLDESRKAIVQMETMPADCFKCGPYALSSILDYSRAHTPETFATLTKYPTTAQGTSLAMVAELANQKLGMKMQPARRLSPEAPLLLPAVINWKLNHYGALLDGILPRVLLCASSDDNRSKTADHLG